ncbi:MAG: glucosamine-6-phosphate deaminase [Oscillospiraceae bacterium]|jgi:glucosamine-6-phosphate deaminase|nr:glucosamine-6-phosphate deaminase [Oscillospiraceae bacterium]
MVVIETKTYAELSRKAGNIIAAQVVGKPKSILGLATGSTPVGTYKELIAKYKSGDLDFSQVQSVNLDEYLGLDGTHDQSYRYFMENNLFNFVNIDKAKTNVPNGKAADGAAEGARYDALIDSLGGIDLQLLGLGPNGHIGFNEPDDYFTASTHVVTLAQKTIDANARFFASANEVPKQAITMGIGAILKAKKVLLIAAGENKRDIVKATISGPITPKVPASILQLHPDVTIIHCPTND